MEADGADTNLDKDCHCYSQTHILHKLYANPTQVQIHVQIQRHKGCCCSTQILRKHKYRDTDTKDQDLHGSTQSIDQSIMGIRNKTVSTKKSPNGTMKLCKSKSKDCLSRRISYILLMKKKFKYIWLM